MKASGGYLSDVGTVEVVFAIGSLIFLLGVVLNIVPLYKALFYNQGAVAHTLVGWLGCAGLSLVLGIAAYQNTRRAHWLRAGTSRYTVAVVTRNFFSRSGRKFAFVYHIGPYQGKDQGECGAGCPATGTRRYVRFAAEAPDVCELTSQPVPDSLRTIPPLGWARLP